MKIEIWSDIMCPFCYIGKRRLESALREFDSKEPVEIIWKSYQLNPDMVTDPSKSINHYLAEIKGWSLEQAKGMNEQVTAVAAGEGLKYDFDKAVVANSFDAHRVIQLAKTKGKGDEMEERFFRAYFTEGQNIADAEVLKALGLEVGLSSEDLDDVISTTAFANDVQSDVQEAMEIGVRGVPFFVFDRKYAISGAHPVSLFLDTMNKTKEGK